MSAHFWWQALGAASVVAAILIGGAMIDLIPWLRARNRDIKETGK